MADVLPIGGVEGITASSEEAKPGGALGKDEFLNLLIAQMSHQDPLDPMDSQATIAQLAQFSSLEQMQNLNDQLLDVRHESGLMNTMLLKDQTILAQVEGGAEVSGVVDSVTWTPEGMTLTIGGEIYNMKEFSNLSIVAPPVAPVAPQE